MKKINFTIEDYALLRTTINDTTINDDISKDDISKLQNQLDLNTKINTIETDQGFMTFTEFYLTDETLVYCIVILNNEYNYMVNNGLIIGQDDLMHISNRIQNLVAC